MNKRDGFYIPLFKQEEDGDGKQVFREDPRHRLKCPKTELTEPLDVISFNLNTYRSLPSTTPHAYSEVSHFI